MSLLNKAPSLSIRDDIVEDKKPTRYFIRFIVDLYNELFNRARWRNEWVRGEYYIKNDMITHDGWLLIANKGTLEEPFSIPVGGDQTLYDANPPFVTQTSPSKVVVGLRVTNPQNLFLLSAVRVWILSNAAAITYRFYIFNHKNSDVVFFKEFTGTQAVDIGWFYMAVPLQIFPDDDYSGFLSTSDSTTDTTYNHPWLYTGKGNTPPATGEAKKTNANNKLLINDVDSDGVDRSSILSLVIPSSIIKLQSQTEPSRSSTFIVIINTQEVGYSEYSVFLETTGTSGEPLNDELVNIIFSVPVENTTSYPQITNYLVPTDLSKGSIKIGDNPREENENGYGIDIVYKQYDVSDDYDVMSTP